MQAGKSSTDYPEKMMGLALHQVQQFLLVCIGLAYVLEQPAEGVTYYVRPDNGSCNVSGIMLTPCYPLHQFNRTMLSKREEMKVLFLQEHHFIPGQYVFKMFNVKKLVLKPWNMSQMVEIRCQHRSYFRLKNVASVTSNLSHVVV